MQYTNIKLAAPTTTTIFSGAGTLHKVIINTPLADGVITIYDNTAGSGDEVGIITKPSTLLSDQVDNASYEAELTTGCTIVTSGAAQNITVGWSQP